MKYYFSNEADVYTTTNSYVGMVHYFPYISLVRAFYNQARRFFRDSIRTGLSNLTTSQVEVIKKDINKYGEFGYDSLNICEDAILENLREIERE